MQKKIIALAIAGLASTAAFAQSNVTVYGVADAYLANVGSGPSHASALNSGGLSGSRLGFKGVEDLGGGTKALFTLEYGLSVDDNTGVGAGTNLARQQFVGLTGDYGTVIAGRLQDLNYNFGAAYNPTFGTAFDTLSSVTTRGNLFTQLSLYNGTGQQVMGVGTAERVNNAIAYVAPAFGGVTVAVAHVFNASATEGVYNSTTRADQASVTYAAGPLSVGAVYTSYSTGTGQQGASQNGVVRDTGVGASYDFGVAKLFGAHTQEAVDGAYDSRTTKFSANSLGLVAPVTAKGAMIVSMSRGQNGADQDFTTYALAYKHALSARTALYAGVARAEATGGSAVASLAGITATATRASTNGNQVNAVLAGVNHSF